MDEHEVMQKLVNRLNDRMIDPEKDYDLLLEELEEIGLLFDCKKKDWYYDYD